MAINFPDSPNNGDTHTAGGKTFTYDSTVGGWTPAAASTDTGGVTVYATVDDLPATGTAGDQAFVTASNRLYLWNGSGWYNIALINTTPSISGAASSYTLETDGTATTVTITATDPEGLPITYSIASDTSGNIATVTQNANVFTITPSTNTANAGSFSLTFRASDGVNIASAISEFTLAFSVQNSNYTTALITSVGTNNQVNNDFVDSSTNSHTITAYGSAAQTTFSPYRHGGYSTYFDGNGDYLAFTDTNVINFGTDDWTFEFWAHLTNTSTFCPFIRTDGVATSVEIGHDFNTNTFKVDARNSAKLSISYTFPENIWTHVAVVSYNGTLSVYINGISIGSMSDSTNWVASGGNCRVGGSGYLNTHNINGFISDLRIVKGTAVYTSAFTPPTERLTAITNTSLLTCHLPYFADGSTNDHTITVNGDTKIEPFSPYDYLQYDADTDGGSVYIGGAAGNYLTIPPGTDFAMGTGDFTFEFWMYHTGYTSYYYADQHGIVWSQDVNNTNWFHIGTGNPTTRKINLQYGTSGGGSSVFSGGTWTPNAWHHVAVVRSSGSVTVYLNGKGGTPASVTQDFNNTTYVPTIGRYTHLEELRYEGWLSDFRVVKGTAVYTADFTPPTAPLTAITNTSLLLSGTNAGIIDKSQAAKSIFLNGDVKSSTTQTKYLSSSMYFDGTGDYIDLPDFVSDYGSKDFTVEVWIYPTAVGTRHNFGDFNSAGQNASSSLVFKFDNDKAKWWIQTTTYNSITSAASISANVWTHIALVRNGSTITQYINGNSDGTFNVGSASINQSSIVYTLGTGGDYQSDFYQGYMSDFRVTKGLARYTANFTPPTAALQG